MNFAIPETLGAPESSMSLDKATFANARRASFEKQRGSANYSLQKFDVLEVSQH